MRSNPGTAEIFCIVLLTGCTAALPPSAAPSALFDADTAASQTAAPGVTYTLVRYDRGPWAIHLLEIDTRACDPVLEARKPGPPLSARATTTDLARDALAAINADFFMIPGGTPVSAHVHDAVPLIGPGDRPVFATTADGWRIGGASQHGIIRVGADSVRVAQVNRAPARTSSYAGTSDGVTLFSSWIGDTVPADTALRMTVRLLAGDARSGSGVVVQVDSVAGVTQLQDGFVALHARGDARAWARRRATGDTVRWSAHVRVAGAEVMEVVGGFPTLIAQGRDVLAQTPVRDDFGPRRHPRTAIGWTADDRLLFVVVDGRQPGWSDGMSLEELAWLFRRLGAVEALNLDGGGSSALVVNGTLVNRVSDAAGERPVGNALVLTRCR